MRVTEPLISYVQLAGPVWAAEVSDSDGQVPPWDTATRQEWAGEMLCAAAVLSALCAGPRILVIVHPSGYGQQSE